MLVGLVLVGLAAISWGTTGATMTALARETAISPLFVGWARLAVAAPFLALAAALPLVRRRTSPRLPSRPPAPIAAYALLGLSMASYQVCYFWAVALTGVAVAALLAICSAPVMIALLAAAVLRERLDARVLVALALAVGGTALLVAGPRGVADGPTRSSAGALLALGAGLSYAVYAVTAKRALARAAPLAVAAFTFSLAALFLAPALAAAGPLVADLRRAAPFLLYLGLGPTAIAYAIFTIGLTRVPATAAGIASLLEPLTATVLGIALFGEALGGLGFAGAAMLLGALTLLAAGRRRRAG